MYLPFGEDLESNLINKGSFTAGVGFSSARTNNKVVIRFLKLFHSPFQENLSIFHFETQQMSQNKPDQYCSLVQKKLTSLMFVYLSSPPSPPNTPQNRCKTHTIVLIKWPTYLKMLYSIFMKPIQFDRI